MGINQQRRQHSIGTAMFSYNQICPWTRSPQTTDDDEFYATEFYAFPVSHVRTPCHTDYLQIFQEITVNDNTYNPFINNSNDWVHFPDAFNANFSVPSDSFFRSMSDQAVQTMGHFGQTRLFGHHPSTTTTTTSTASAAPPISIHSAFPAASFNASTSAFSSTMASFNKL